jgi:calcineurin-like phosphoesterase family protein
MLFFTGDTHFGDTRVLRIDRRPFGSVKEHDEALVGYWNETVRPDDEVWHLGDFTRGSGKSRADALLSVLNGRKHLIIGNNDDETTISAGGWASTQHYAEMWTGSCSSSAIIRSAPGTRWARVRSICMAIRMAG